MFRRAIDSQLAERLAASRAAIQVVWGPRQVGKSTSVRALVAECGVAAHYATVGAPATHTTAWIRRQWEIARASAALGPTVLALDGITHIPGWAAEAAALFAEDTAAGRDLKVVVVGTLSAALQAELGAAAAMAPGAPAAAAPTAPAAAACVPIRMGHWTFAECREAFDWDLDSFLFFGGYPGGAALAADVAEWREYMIREVLEPTLTHDILLTTRVDKPALMRELLALACEHSGRVMSYTAMRDRLTDAGNTTTLAHYLELLAAGGLVAGLPKYSGGAARKRASSPKLNVLDTGLMAALAGRTPAEMRRDQAWRGRLVESAIGAYLMARAPALGLALSYWRQGERSVDFVLEGAERLLALEFRTAAADIATHSGLAAFRALYPHARPLVEGGGGVTLDRFLAGETGV